MGLLYRRGRRRRQWKPGIDWGIGLSNKRLDPHIYIALLFLSILQVHLCVTATAHAVQQSDNIEHHHLRSRAVESESSWTCNAFYQSLVTGEPYVQPISNDLTLHRKLLPRQEPEPINTETAPAEAMVPEPPQPTTPQTTTPAIADPGAPQPNPASETPLPTVTSPITEATLATTVTTASSTTETGVLGPTPPTTTITTTTGPDGLPVPTTESASPTVTPVVETGSPTATVTTITRPDGSSATLTLGVGIGSLTETATTFTGPDGSSTNVTLGVGTGSPTETATTFTGPDGSSTNVTLGVGTGSPTATITTITGADGSSTTVTLGVGTGSPTETTTTDTATAAPTGDNVTSNRTTETLPTGPTTTTTIPAVVPTATQQTLTTVTNGSPAFQIDPLLTTDSSMSFSTGTLDDGINATDTSNQTLPGGVFTTGHTTIRPTPLPGEATLTTDPGGLPIVTTQTESDQDNSTSTGVGLNSTTTSTGGLPPINTGSESTTTSTGGLPPINTRTNIEEGSTTSTQTGQISNSTETGGLPPIITRTASESESVSSTESSRGSTSTRAGGLPPIDTRIETEQRSASSTGPSRVLTNTGTGGLPPIAMPTETEPNSPGTMEPSRQLTTTRAGGQPPLATQTDVEQGKSSSIGPGLNVSTTRPSRVLDTPTQGQGNQGSINATEPTRTPGTTRTGALSTVPSKASDHTATKTAGDTPVDVERPTQVPEIMTSTSQSSHGGTAPTIASPVSHSLETGLGSSSSASSHSSIRTFKETTLETMDKDQPLSTSTSSDPYAWVPSATLIQNPSATKSESAAPEASSEAAVPHAEETPDVGEESDTTKQQGENSKQDKPPKAELPSEWPSSIVPQQDAQEVEEGEEEVPVGLAGAVAAKRPVDTSLVSILFTKALSWSWLLSQSDASAQVFAYMPMLITGSLGLEKNAVITVSLEAWEPPNWNGDGADVRSVWVGHVPTKKVDHLAALLVNTSSKLYSSKQPVIKQLAGCIDPSLPLLSLQNSLGLDPTDEDPTAAHGTEKAGKMSNKTTAFVASAAALGAIVVAVGAFFASRYAMKKRAEAAASTSQRTRSSGSSSQRQYASGQNFDAAVTPMDHLDYSRDSYGAQSDYPVTERDSMRDTYASRTPTRARADPPDEYRDSVYSDMSRPLDRQGGSSYYPTERSYGQTARSRSRRSASGSSVQSEILGTRPTSGEIPIRDTWWKHASQWNDPNGPEAHHRGHSVMSDPVPKSGRIVTLDRPFSASSYSTLRTADGAGGVGSFNQSNPFGYGTPFGHRVPSTKPRKISAPYLQDNSLML